MGIIPPDPTWTTPVWNFYTPQSIFTPIVSSWDTNCYTNYPWPPNAFTYAYKDPPRAKYVTVYGAIKQRWWAYLAGFAPAARTYEVIEPVARTFARVRTEMKIPCLRTRRKSALSTSRTYRQAVRRFMRS